MLSCAWTCHFLACPSYAVLLGVVLSGVVHRLNCEELLHGSETIAVTMPACMSVCVYIYIYICVCMHVVCIGCLYKAYIHTYIHTYIHVYNVFECNIQDASHVYMCIVMYIGIDIDIYIYI